MNRDAVILLRPPGDPPKESGRPATSRHDALDEIVEGLREGAYAVHHSGSDRQHTMVVHQGDRLSYALGGRGDLPLSILVSTHDDGSDGDPAAEALLVLSSPVFDDDGTLRRRIGTIACAIACASGARADQEDHFFISTASPWGPFAMTRVDTDGIETAVEVDPRLAAMLPMVVDADWKVLDTSETTLETIAFFVTVWPHLRIDAMEAMRILSDLEREPLIA